MTRRVAAVLSAACIAILGSGTASWAGQGHSKPAVCHPTGKGWVVIKPAQASSHIDEATGAPKHEHSGRVDVYAVNGACPTIPTTTPTTTGSTPSGTTTSSTTAPTPSTTATSVPSLSTTSSTPTTRATTNTSPTTTSVTTSPQTFRGSSVPSRTTEPSPRNSAPSSTAELAATGSSLGGVIVAAAFLLTVGLLVLAFHRVLGRREGGHR